MPPYYIGGGTDPFAGFGKSLPSGPDIVPGKESGLNPNDRWPWLRQPPGKATWPPANPTPALPGGTPTPQPGNVLGAQAVRATGDPKGYDPSYLQNLATAIGGLFSNRSGGPMNINPLGNLSEISPASGMEGNAPLLGLPSTWLQDALNGLGFSFAPVTPKPTGPRNLVGGGGGDDGRGRGGRRFNLG